MVEEEGSGVLTPISSTASTAVDHPSLSTYFSSPSKSPLVGTGEDATPISLGVPVSQRAAGISFSSVHKLPELEPSPSRLRRQFDFALLRILQFVTWLYLACVGLRHRVLNKVLEVWYGWRAWTWWGEYWIQRDIATFEKIPRHVAAILDVKRPAREYDADEMVKRVVDLATWCSCVGISIVTVYEPTGLLKKDIKRIQRALQKLAPAYPSTPSFQRVDVRSPQSALLENESLSEDKSMDVLVISKEDSRPSIVDLARTLGDMTKQGKLYPEDVTIDLIDENLTENLMTDPDLLILCSPRVELQGFPPWQINLTEIFHLPENSTFNYSVFLRALQAYNKAEMRFGK